MKIGDSLPSQAARDGAAQNAAGWRSQLERSWLGAWHHEGSQAMQPNGLAARPDGDGSVSDKLAHFVLPVLATAVSSRNEAPVAPVAASGLDASEAVTGLVARTFPSVVDRPVDGVASSGVRTPLASNDDGMVAEVRHPTEIAHHALRAPVPRNLLQVAIVGDQARVSLRDAGLSAAEVTRVAHALGEQLRALGHASVHVYINGVESRHGDGPTGAADPLPSIPSLPEKD